MSALADLFSSAGAGVSGSDVEELFYTDKVLQDLNIPYVTSFESHYLNENTDLVIYSSAYRLDENPQLIKAQKLGIPILSYTQALGLYSMNRYSCGVAGVHGKTTTTALIGSVLKWMKMEGSVLVGSALPLFDNRSIWKGGDHFFVAETCEYRRHFLNFHPTVILLTNVEADHLDYYKDEADVEDAFVEYVCRLPANGVLVYCADDEGACRVAKRALEQLAWDGREIEMISYGFSTEADCAVSFYRQEAGVTRFGIHSFETEFELRIPGKHLIQDAVGAAVVARLLGRREGIGASVLEGGIASGLRAFNGTRRRSEIIGEVNGILIVDDYAHHPTEISVTLEGFRQFYPNRRIVVDFMSHTYSRTEALLDQFATCFESADLVLINKIYASAREKAGSVTGETLYQTIAKNHCNIHYFDESMDALPFLLQELKAGDLFITMGAGDNWQLGRALWNQLNKEKELPND